MKIHLSLLLVSGLGALIQTPAPKDDDGIVLPIGPVVPTPMPSPNGMIRLSGESQYVITGNVKFTIRDHPKGIVKVDYDTGPVKIRGKFVDGTGQIETRTFKAPFVATLTSVGTGRVEIDVVPVGFKDDSQIKTATIDVDSGQGPQPPPNPQPVPPTPKVIGKIFVVVLTDRLNNDPATAGALASATFRKYLSDNGYELDIIDTGTAAGKGRAAQYASVLAKYKVSGDAIAILDADSKPPGLVLNAIGLPKSDADLVSFVKTTTGK